MFKKIYYFSEKIYYIIFMLYVIIIGISLFLSSNWDNFKLISSISFLLLLYGSSTIWEIYLLFKKIKTKKLFIYKRNYLEIIIRIIIGIILIYAAISMYDKVYFSYLISFIIFIIIWIIFDIMNVFLGVKKQCKLID